jgi:O-antigen/teichoic acid export membrane protein
MSQAANNKRIAKNTLLLYIRMLFGMCVSLYTSRVILQALGIENYGIYNVVGGIVTMFTFLNGAIVASTQRFLSFELGRSNKVRLSQIFSTSLQIHVLLSLLIFILAETIGLWFLNEELVIPEGRMHAAMWVYQISVISCIIRIMSVPYNADIIAHEKMSAFAYISILELVLKLIVAYLLYISPWDKLITYAVFLLLIQVLMRCIYTIYCNKHFSETIYHHQINKEIFKEMFSFAGWSFSGSLAVMLYSQGLNMLLNIFFGPIVNAARGIAIQVQGAVQGFVGNFQMALNPQITKNYAIGNLHQMHSLIYRSSKFSFFILYLLTLPILLKTEDILLLWLKEIPENSVVFTQWMIIISLLSAVVNPCSVANQATGRVKTYQLIVGGILLLIIPISYFVLSSGYPAHYVFIVHFCLECIAQIARIFLLRKQIHFSVISYIHRVVVPILLVVITSIILPLHIQRLLGNDLLSLIGLIIVSICSVGITTLYLGLTNNERNFLIDKSFNLLKKGMHVFKN